MWQRSCVVGGGLLLVHYGGSSAIGGAVKTAIEAADRHVIGTDITIGSCEISLLQGRVKVYDLAVHNPPGFPEQPLLSVNKAVFDLSMLGLLLRRAIVIEELTFEDLNVDVQYNSEGVSNCAHIQEHLSESVNLSHRANASDDSTSSSPPAETEDVIAKVAVKRVLQDQNRAESSVAAESQKHPIELRKVHFTGIQAKYGWATCALGDIKYDHFSEEVGATCIDDIAHVVMSTVMKSVSMNAAHLFSRITSAA
eukprot:GEMP01051213.1.p1 GENE.GEMP01051213.1~~GEMP01051213.1.p1  ORF type:complete len:262 (+),score=58.46 GEMP01051213.1:29-787(+)